jgi:hypothetical protein
MCLSGLKITILNFFPIIVKVNDKDTGQVPVKSAIPPKERRVKIPADK